MMDSESSYTERNTLSSTKTSSPLDDAMTHIDKAIAEQQDVVSALLDRLHIVMRGANPEGIAVGSVTDMDARAPHVRKLIGVGAEIAQTTDRIRDALQRLDV